MRSTECFFIFQDGKKNVEIRAVSFVTKNGGLRGLDMLSIRLIEIASNVV